jgi:hypothetical protein
MSTSFVIVLRQSLRDEFSFKFVGLPNAYSEGSVLLFQFRYLKGKYSEALVVQNCPSASAFRALLERILKISDLPLQANDFLFNDLERGDFRALRECIPRRYLCAGCWWWTPNHGVPRVELLLAFSY